MIFGDAPDRLPHQTTNPHELALSVVFESGLQHFVSTPAMIDAQPDYVKEFLTAVPTAWDETRFVDGYPGSSRCWRAGAAPTGTWARSRRTRWCR